MSSNGGLELYRDEISALFCLGHTPHDIRKILARHRIRATNHAVQRCIQSWGVDQSVTVHDEEWNLVQRLVDKHLRSGRHRKTVKRAPRLPSIVRTSDGPNHVWLLVPYRGLERFGIQVKFPSPLRALNPSSMNVTERLTGIHLGQKISVAIDDYSNEDLWVEVGVDASSGNSVCRQYLDYVSGRLFQPQVLQTDFWGFSEETEHVADAHYLLRRAGPGREYMFLENIQPPSLEDCLRTGSADDRMQVWHNKFTKSYARFWIRYFSHLEDKGLFNVESELDKVALLAVYLPMIQHGVQSYVGTKSSTEIRQPIGASPRKLPESCKISSRLYAWDKRGAKDHQLQVDHILLEDLRRDFVPRNEDEYLPSDTLKWCQTKLQDLGFHPTDPPSRTTDEGKNTFSKPYQDIYLRLRQLVHEHDRAGESPRLSLYTKKIL